MPKNSVGTSPKVKVTHSLLLDAVLSRQLSDHLNFLQGFMRLFQELDTDADGIIDEAAFEALYRRINFILDGQGHGFSDHEQREMSDLKRAIDPCATNKLVLSDIIRAFMAHPVASQAASGETSES